MAEDIGAGAAVGAGGVAVDVARAGVVAVDAAGAAGRGGYVVGGGGGVGVNIWQRDQLSCKFNIQPVTYLMVYHCHRSSLQGRFRKLRENVGTGSVVCLG